MRQSTTQPLARHREITGEFNTEPFECAWANEALFFLRIQECTGNGAKLDARVQISADGIHWIDEGTQFEPLGEVGSAFVRVRHFGGWLRLACRARGDDSRFNVMIHLALKE